MQHVQQMVLEVQTSLLELGPEVVVDRLDVLLDAIDTPVELVLRNATLASMPGALT